MSTLTPALDFCRKVSTWQEAGGGSAGLPMLIPDREQAALDGILRDFRTRGASALLEDRARFWLVGYREMEGQQRVLTAAQRAELAAVVGRLAPATRSFRSARENRRIWMLSAAVLAGLALLILIAFTVSYLITAGSRGNPAPAGGAAPPAVQQVPAGMSELESFRRDWGPFTQLAADGQHPQTQAPALLLLSDGGYYATRWLLLSADPAWSPDLGGNITAVSVRGSWVLFTDADGNDWVAGTGQPFVLARNPGTVLEIGNSGTVLSMPVSHAAVIRRVSRTGD